MGGEGRRRRTRYNCRVAARRLREESRRQREDTQGLGTAAADTQPAGGRGVPDAVRVGLDDGGIDCRGSDGYLAAALGPVHQREARCTGAGGGSDGAGRGEADDISGAEGGGEGGGGEGGGGSGDGRW